MPTVNKPRKKRSSSSTTPPVKKAASIGAPVVEEKNFRVFLQLANNEKGRAVWHPMPNQFGTFEVNDKNQGIFSDFLNTKLSVTLSVDFMELIPGSVIAVKTLNEEVGYYTPSEYPVEVINNGSPLPRPLMEDKAQCISASVEVEQYFEEFYSRVLAQMDSEELKEGFVVEPEQPNYMQGLRHNPTFAPPTIEDDGLYVDPETWYEVIRAIDKKQNILLKGPSGTGKSSYAYMVTKRLGIGITDVDMGQMEDAVSGLLGVHRLKNGKSEFQLAPFAKAVVRPGLILLDEVNRCSPSAVNILFPCVDFRRTLNISIAELEEDRTRPVHEDASFFATANIGYEFSGTNALDAAWGDRFNFLEIGFPPEDKEVELLMKVHGIDKLSSEKVVKAANAVRELYGQGRLSASVSFRGTGEMASKIKDGYRTEDAIKSYLLPRFSGSVDSGEKQIVVETVGIKI